VRGSDRDVAIAPSRRSTRRASWSRPARGPAAAARADRPPCGVRSSMRMQPRPVNKASC